MALIRFTLPDLGEGLGAAEIVEWHASPGDRLVTEQPLVSVETDKAVVEIPCPVAGTLRTALAAQGETLDVGAPLAEFDTDTVPDAGAIVGVLPSDEPTPPSPPTRPISAGGGTSVRAMPAARALARTHEIDLAALSGTGPDGVVMRADVATSLDANGAEWTPLTGARRAMAQRMEHAREVVRATITDLADVTAWFDPQADVLFRLARSMAHGVKASPHVNAWFDPVRSATRRHATLHLALAVDTEAGLYVPVIHDADRLDAVAFREHADRLVADARSRRLTAADQAGATLTLSSFGTLSGRFAELVVSPPQVAILGAGRVFERYQSTGTQLSLPLSLTFDHRAMTGGDAARFLAAVVNDLAQSV